MKNGRKNDLESIDILSIYLSISIFAINIYKH